jgi:membrane-associated phospholipid phosphatase
MSANNNSMQRTYSFLSEALLIPRRAVSNLSLWIAILVRRPRAKTPPVGMGAFIMVAGVVAIIVAFMFFLDTPASVWARQLSSSFKDPAEQMSDLGRSAVFLYPLGFFLLIISALTRRSLPFGVRGILDVFAARAGFLFVAIGLPGLFDTVIKRLIGRARPYVGGYDQPFAYRPFVWQSDYASMPSGHSTTAAAAAIAIGAIWPQARPFAWVYALMVMSARVVLNAHHPSDVIAGAVVGTIGALMVRRWFAARRLVFSPSDLRPLPGPSWRRIKAGVCRAFVEAPQAT